MTTAGWSGCIAARAARCSPAGCSAIAPIPPSEDPLGGSAEELGHPVLGQRELPCRLERPARREHRVVRREQQIGRSSCRARYLKLSPYVCRGMWKKTFIGAIEVDE